ncbi:MAG TPA: site-specific integrase [Burkholderiaceae bacterium]|nr:site-specific integrase [Burkholderiaceae bacterium]
MLDRWLTEEVQHQKSALRTRQRVTVLREFTAGKSLADLVTVAGQLKTAEAKPATINRYLSVLRRIGNLAEQWGLLERAPRITLLPERNERHVYLTPAEVQRLAAKCQPEVGDAVRLAALTGLRRSELLRLRPSDLRDGALLLDARTKSGRPRLVPLPPEALRIARARLPWTIDAYQLRAGFESARKAARLPHVRFHDLRHTYASWLVQSGQSMKAVKDLLGHSTMAMTDRYAHLAAPHLVQAVSGLRLGTGGERVGKKVKTATGRKRPR